MPLDSSEFEGDRERSKLAGGDLAVGGGVVKKRGIGPGLKTASAWWAGAIGMQVER